MLEEFHGVIAAMDDRRSIVGFLIKAKKSTYAGNGKPIESSRPCSIDLTYSEDNLVYYDSYFGTNPFIGEETLRLDDKVIWSMNYIGRKLDDEFEYDFLKEALMNVRPERPFRGPSIYTSSDYTYESSEKGDFNWFQGHETIKYKGRMIYEGHYHGGSVQ